MNAKEALERMEKDRLKLRIISATYFSTEHDQETIFAALTELEAIKKRAEEKREELGAIFDEANEDNPYSVDGDDNVTYYTETAVIELIGFIINGPKEGEGK